MLLTFHTGPNPNNNGLGQFMQRIANAGFTPWIKATDTYGGIPEATGRNGYAVRRLSTAGQQDGYDYDVPDYALDPILAASRHWDATRAKIPPEFDKTRVWIEPINEVNREHADWLGRFGVEFAKLANAAGYMVTMFGWASGTPEPHDWSTPGMLDYLRYCQDNPGRAAVALHEYNTENQPIGEMYPDHIGRFEKRPHNRLT